MHYNGAKHAHTPVCPFTVVICSILLLNYPPRCDFHSDNNALVGTIPTEIGKLANIEVLEVDVNELTGTIPTELGNLLNMVEMDLDKNKLTGTVPTEFGTMINIGEIDLSKLVASKTEVCFTMEMFIVLLREILPFVTDLIFLDFYPEMPLCRGQPAFRFHSN